LRKPTIEYSGVFLAHLAPRRTMLPGESTVSHTRTRP
jgi:hypothetical protein